MENKWFSFTFIAYTTPPLAHTFSVLLSSQYSYLLILVRLNFRILDNANIIYVLYIKSMIFLALLFFLKVIFCLCAFFIFCVFSTYLTPNTISHISTPPFSFFSLPKTIIYIVFLWADPKTVFSFSLSICLYSKTLSQHSLLSLPCTLSSFQFHFQC